MEFKSVSDYFPHVNWQKPRRLMTMEKAKWQVLNENTYIEGIPFAKGSRFKAFETTNFGWLVFDNDARTPEGHIPGRRIFKF